MTEWADDINTLSSRTPRSDTGIPRLRPDNRYKPNFNKNRNGLDENRSYSNLYNNRKNQSKASNNNLDQYNNNNSAPDSIIEENDSNEQPNKLPTPDILGEDPIPIRVKHNKNNTNENENRVHRGKIYETSDTQIDQYKKQSDTYEKNEINQQESQNNTNNLNNMNFDDSKLYHRMHGRKIGKTDNENSKRINTGTSRLQSQDNNSDRNNDQSNYDKSTGKPYEDKQDIRTTQENGNYGQLQNQNSNKDDWPTENPKENKNKNYSKPDIDQLTSKLPGNTNYEMINDRMDQDNGQKQTGDNETINRKQNEKHFNDENFKENKQPNYNIPKTNDGIPMNYNNDEAFDRSSTKKFRPAEKNSNNDSYFPNEDQNPNENKNNNELNDGTGEWTGRVKSSTSNVQKLKNNNNNNKPENRYLLPTIENSLTNKFSGREQKPDLNSEKLNNYNGNENLNSERNNTGIDKNLSEEEVRPESTNSFRQRPKTSRYRNNNRIVSASRSYQTMLDTPLEENEENDNDYKNLPNFIADQTDKPSNNENEGQNNGNKKNNIDPLTVQQDNYPTNNPFNSGINNQHYLLTYPDVQINNPRQYNIVYPESYQQYGIPVDNNLSNGDVLGSNYDNNLNYSASALKNANPTARNTTNNNYFLYSKDATDIDMSDPNFEQQKEPNRDLIISSRYDEKNKELLNKVPKNMSNGEYHYVEKIERFTPTKKSTRNMIIIIVAILAIIIIVGVAITAFTLYMLIESQSNTDQNCNGLICNDNFQCVNYECECKTGYYLSNTTCLSKKSYHTSCTTSLECDDSKLLLCLNQSGGSTACDCNSGYVWNSSASKCSN